METIKKDIEKEELKSDREHLKELYFNKEIINTYYNILDELHMKIVEELELTDVHDLELIRKAINIMKNFN